MKTMVFWLRLGFFFIVALLPSLHPGVAVDFDATRLWFCFALVSASCLLGFYGPALPRFKGISLGIFIALLGCAGTLAIAGSTSTFLFSTLSAFGLFFLTWLAFRRGLVRLLYVEPFFIVWLAWRLVGFSRSSTAMATLSRFPSVVIGTLAIAACMIYALEYSGARAAEKKSRRVGYIRLALGAVAMLLLFSFALFRLPETATDLIRRLDSADNRVSPPKKKSPKGIKSVNPNGGIDGGTVLSSGSSDSGEGELYETGDENWRDGPTANGGAGGQYLVMIVSSPVDPLYLAESYRALLDPIEGFQADASYYPNQLARTPYLETWENNLPMRDMYRNPIWIEVYSTIPDKVVSWLPYRVEPTVRDEKNYPLRYYYRALSLVSSCGLRNTLPFVAGLSDSDRVELADALAVSLSPADLAPFAVYVGNLLAGEASYTGKIQRILRGFNDCTYQASENDDTTISAMRKFLFVTKTGDCTEFSNTAALLARIAGIPSRVVTGYALKRELQTKAHAEGLRTIQERFAPLAGKDPSRLFLVTTAHAHSWPQFYVPGAGWVDFEATAYASPPEKGGDPNAMDIVIPQFDGESPASAKYSFPWRILLKLMIAAILLAFAARIVRRWYILLALSVHARFLGEKGTKARFRLFLICLASRGYRPKSRDETPDEYGRANPELSPIMALYERAIFHPSEKERRAARFRLDEDIREFLSARRSVLVVLRELSGTKDRILL